MLGIIMYKSVLQNNTKKVFENIKEHKVLP